MLLNRAVTNLDILNIKFYKSIIIVLFLRDNLPKKNRLKLGV